jgi:translin
VGGIYFSRNQMIMDNLAQITERIRDSFEARNRARDEALAQARKITRSAANAIRAVHRNDHELARSHLQHAGELFEALRSGLTDYPDLYFAGYTQDAIKEFVEASIFSSVIWENPFPTPEELSVEPAAYVNGLAESVGEMRRRCLDILRQGYSQEAEQLLSYMDDIYVTLISLDYPDAITNGLRRQTDLMRSILERTRGDLTLSLRQHRLQQSIEQLMEKLPED